MHLAPEAPPNGLIAEAFEEFEARRRGRPLLHSPIKQLLTRMVDLLSRPQRSTINSHLDRSAQEWDNRTLIERVDSHFLLLPGSE